MQQCIVPLRLRAPLYYMFRFEDEGPQFRFVSRFQEPFSQHSKSTISFRNVLLFTGVKRKRKCALMRNIPTREADFRARSLHRSRHLHTTSAELDFQPQFQVDFGSPSRFVVYVWQ